MKVKFVPRSAYVRSADGFCRSSRHAQNQLPRTMPAGRGKALHAYPSHLGAAEFTVSQMAPYHESIRRRIRSIFCDPAGQPNPRVPRVLISDNKS
jgi:hypothetical protein